MKLGRLLHCWMFWVACVVTTRGESWIFETEEAAKAAFPKDEIVSRIIADPSYDQTFKKIMSTDTDKQEALINFLNSIYFPDAEEDDVKIREIQPLDKEYTELGKESQIGVKFCDIACRCFYYAVDGQPDLKGGAFDIEMQRSTQRQILGRLVDYGQKLREKNKLGVRVLGLLNFQKVKHDDDATECYALCKIDPETNQPSRMEFQDDLLEINAIDLRKLSESDNIFINGKVLKITGITWLKLFGVKQWCAPIEKDKVCFKIYYPEKEIDKNIKSVIESLSMLDQETLYAIERQKKAEQDALETAKEEGRTEGIREGRKRGKEEGINEERYKIARKMYSKHRTINEIADFLEISEEEVQGILKSPAEKKQKLTEDEGQIFE